MAISTPHALLPQYSPRAAKPRTRLQYVLLFLLLLLIGCFYGLMVALLPVQVMMVPLVPILLLFALSMWVMPDLNRYNDASIETAFLWFFALYIVWPNYIAIDLPGLPWITFTRVALFWLMVQFIPALATSTVLRAEIGGMLKISKPFYWFFLMFFIAQIISLPFGKSPLDAMVRFSSNQIYWTGMLFLGCHMYLKPGNATKTIAWLIPLAVITSLLGIWENRIEHVPWADHIPALFQVEGEYLGRILGSQARATDGFYRVHSVFPVSLTFAEFLTLALAFVIHYIVSTPSMLIRGLNIGAYILITLAILYTHSRLGMVGFFGSHFAYAIIWSLRRQHFQKHDMIAPSLTYGFPAIVAAFVVAVAVNQRLRVMLLGGNSSQSSNDARYMQRDQAIPIILKNPIGHGAGQGSDALNFTNGAGVTTVDSYFLTLLLDYGIFGFIGYFGMLISACVIGMRTFFRHDDPELALCGPIVVILVNWMLIKLVLSQETIQPLMFLLLGMLLALTYRGLAIEKSRPPVVNALVLA